MQGLVFELSENTGGHASGATRMTFSNESDPFRATYTGPNISYGHAIVAGGVMLYHAVHSDGSLSAGRADVELSDEQMLLRWQWLTGEPESGVSVWKRIN